MRASSGSGPVDMSGILGFLDDIWSCISRPSTLAWLAASSMAAAALGVVSRLPGPASSIDHAASKSALVERAQVFFVLHDPLLSWWFSVLIVATLVALFAVILERLHEAGGDEEAAGGLRVCKVLVLAAIGAGLIAVAAGLAVERRWGLYGEVLLRRGVPTDAVTLASPHGRSWTRLIGVSVTASAIEPDSLRLITDEGLEITLEPSAPESMRGRSFHLRSIGEAPEAELFVISMKDTEGREPASYRVRRNQSFGPAADPSTRFVIIDHRPQGWGAGPAVRLAREDAGTPGHGALPTIDLEPFWVFSRPGFDERNRRGDHAFDLVEVLREREAIVAVTRSPGRLLLTGGALFVSLGLVLFAPIGYRIRRIGAERRKA